MPHDDTVVLTLLRELADAAPGMDADRPARVLAAGRVHRRRRRAGLAAGAIGLTLASTAGVVGALAATRPAPRPQVSIGVESVALGGPPASGGRSAPSQTDTSERDPRRVGGFRLTALPPGYAPTRGVRVTRSGLTTYQRPYAGALGEPYVSVEVSVCPSGTVCGHQTHVVAGQHTVTVDGVTGYEGRELRHDGLPAPLRLTWHPHLGVDIYLTVFGADPRAQQVLDLVAAGIRESSPTPTTPPHP